MLPNRLQLGLLYSRLLLTGLVLLTLYSNAIRTVFLYVHRDQLAGASSYLLHCFWIGTRLDLKTGAILFSPMLLLGLIAVLFKFQSRAFYTFYKVLIVIFLTLALIFFVGNYYFYQTFNSNFNEALFGFVGQPGVVVSIMWQDYPIVRSALLLILNAWLLLWMLPTRRCEERFSRRGNPEYLTSTLDCHVGYASSQRRCLRSIYLILFLLTYTFLTRGSFTLFPLGKEEANFSTNAVVNAATYNGVIALSDALTDHSTNLAPAPVSLDEGLHDYNLYYDKKLKAPRFSFASLFTHTPHNAFLEAHPPHVIFVQLESAGRHILLFDNAKTNDLLGNLRPYTEKDLFFTHVLSGANGTKESLIGLLFSSSLTTLLENPLNEASYQTSVALPYKQAGYKTIFLTSGSLGWQNTGVALHHQGFDETIGDFDLMKKYPEAVSKDYGVLDEYAFKEALALLQEAQKKHQPLFIYINTVTNHPPYVRPPHYQPKPLTVPQDFAKSKEIPTDRMLAMLETYQYVNSTLGDFMSAIDHSDLKNHTLVAASGDHNQHEFKAHYPDEKEFALQYGVFFLLHVPSAYLPAKPINTAQLASHKDIFPTLYHLSLSNADYANLGNNLAAQKPSSPFVFAYNAEEVLLEEGLIKLNDPEQKLYPWQDKNKIYLSAPRPLTKAEKKLVQRIQAYGNLLRWHSIWQYYRNQNNQPHHNRQS